MRRAAARDLDALALLYRALLEHHAALDPAFALHAGVEARLAPALARVLRDEDAAVFVWEEAGRIEGFCAVRIERGAGLLAEAARTEITELGVRPGRRRRGLGRELVHAACEWAAARAAARVEVRVAARNREGQAFWRALGYEAFVDVLQRRLESPESAASHALRRETGPRT
jgi:GNAT superfamily N-acetyltransferase